jgi:hypothetical protein
MNIRKGNPDDHIYPAYYPGEQTRNIIKLLLKLLKECNPTTNYSSSPIRICIKAKGVGDRKRSPTPVNQSSDPDGHIS